MTHRTLTDAQWRRIEGLVPGKKGDHGRPARDNRLFVEACLWRAKNSARWADLPEDFGPWKAVYLRFRRWALSGVWAAVLEALRSEADVSSNVLQDTIWTVKPKRRPSKERAVQMIS